ncbi:hypothetical protein T484DRAFT_1874378, partial [Baffinella frigidus]
MFLEVQMEERERREEAAVVIQALARGFTLRARLGILPPKRKPTGASAGMRPSTAGSGSKGTASHRSALQTPADSTSGSRGKPPSTAGSGSGSKGASTSHRSALQTPAGPRSAAQTPMDATPAESARRGEGGGEGGTSQAGSVATSGSKGSARGKTASAAGDPSQGKPSPVRQHGR